MSEDDLTRAAAMHRQRAAERRAASTKRRTAAPPGGPTDATPSQRVRPTVGGVSPQMRELYKSLAQSDAQAWLARKRGSAAVATGGQIPQGLSVRTPRRGRQRAPLAALSLPQDAGLLHPLVPELPLGELQVSVVMGTYNRRPLLERAVASVRAAAKDISYEIRVCDGGSTDGSVDWLKAQPDVVYVAGTLTGAVRAFNAAAENARGRFIVCLNDDAELLPDALQRGLARFDNPRVGQVAMAFHENGAWKIDVMHGRPYGNFPITRASVVRAATHICGGLWAPCYYTYGGDNELSAWVYRLGYELVVADDARVRHHEHVDGLRSKNVTSDTQRRRFSERWPDASRMQFRGTPPGVTAAERGRLATLEAGETPAQRWGRISSVDPVRGELPPRRTPSAERVLHYHLWTAEDPQRSLAEAMASLGSAGHARIDWPPLDPRARAATFVDAARRIRPTVVFLQLQAPDALAIEAIRRVRTDPERDPSLVVCAWSGDVGPGKGPWPQSSDAWQYALSRELDLMLFSGTGQVQMHRGRGMTNAAYLQIGYDTDRYHPGPDSTYGRRHSVVFMGQDYGPQFDAVPGNDAALRRQVVRALSRVPGFSAWGSGFGPPMSQSRSGDVYRGSAMAVSISLTSQLGRYTSDRMIRSMACGCPTLVKRFDDMEGMGLRHEENCLVWDTVADLLSLVRTWLQEPRRPRLREIGRAGAHLMQTNHTWSVRLHELAALLCAVRGQP